MKRTTQTHTGIGTDPTPARVLRQARSAAIVTEPRIQLGFDRSSGEYVLALL